MAEEFPTEVRRVRIEYTIQAPEVTVRTHPSDMARIAAMAAEMVNADPRIEQRAVSAVNRAMRRGRGV